MKPKAFYVEFVVVNNITLANKNFVDIFKKLLQLNYAITSFF